MTEARIPAPVSQETPTETSPYLVIPGRSRIEAALDRAHTALAELLAVVDLADDGGGVPEPRHQAAKREARRAILDIATLRGGGR